MKTAPFLPFRQPRRFFIDDNIIVVASVPVHLDRIVFFNMAA